MVCTTDTLVFSVAFHNHPSQPAMRTAPYRPTSDCLRMMENNMLLVEIAWSPSDLCQITHVTENWMGTYVICTSRRMKIGLSGVCVPAIKFHLQTICSPSAARSFLGGNEMVERDKTINIFGSHLFQLNLLKCIALTGGCQVLLPSPRVCRCAMHLKMKVSLEQHMTKTYLIWFKVTTGRQTCCEAFT